MNISDISALGMEQCLFESFRPLDLIITDPLKRALIGSELEYGMSIEVSYLPKNNVGHVMPAHLTMCLLHHLKSVLLHSVSGIIQCIKKK